MSQISLAQLTSFPNSHSPLSPQLTGPGLIATAHRAGAHRHSSQGLGSSPHQVSLSLYLSLSHNISIFDFVWIRLGGEGGLTKERAEEGYGFVPDGFENRVLNQGIVVRDWAPQMANLSHQVVGGFLLKRRWPMEADQFVKAKLALVQMKNWFMRFPTILQACECIIEMLRGQYVHSVGCYNEATFHYIEAVKALDLIRPVYSVMDSFIGVREKTSVLFAYGLLLMKQQDLQEARKIIKYLKRENSNSMLVTHLMKTMMGWKMTQ